MTAKARPSAGAMARRAAAVLAGGLLAACAGLGGPAAAAPGARAVPADGPPPASVTTVQRALGVKDVPTAIVFLVDISESMGPAPGNDLYPEVRQKVLNYIKNLHQEAPQDLVGMVLFSDPHNTQVYQLRSPDPDQWLPTVPYEPGTDFGYAFEKAIDMLTQAPSAFKIGGVLLLSDGEPNVSREDDHEYGGAGFAAPGWSQLQSRARHMPMSVTAYDIPLTRPGTRATPDFAQNQRAALSRVFDNVQPLSGDIDDLDGALNLAGLRVLSGNVTTAVALDQDKGVHVTWNDLRSLAGAPGKPFDLKTGHATITLTVTSEAPHVELYLSHLAITAPGWPVTVHASLPAIVELDHHQAKRLQVRLTWPKPQPGGMTWRGPRTLTGGLVLGGDVSSTFTPVLTSTFSDTGFKVGGIQGGASPRFLAIAPAKWNISVIVYTLIAALIALAGATAFRARLRGRLILTSVDDDQGAVELSGLLVRASTQELIRLPGQLTVHGFGSLLRPNMSVGLKLAGRPKGHRTLRPGEKTLVAGIYITHDKDGGDGEGSQGRQ